MELRKKIIFGIFEKNEGDFAKYSCQVKTANLQKKSVAHSNELRKQGNDLFLQNKNDSKSNEQIFLKYTESIAFAPSGSETLALAYGNRSALLLRTRKFKESIEDVDKALGITKSIPLKIKLLCRKVECLKRQGSTDFKKILKEAQDVVDNCIREDEKIEFQSKFINKAKGHFEVCDEPKTKKHALTPNSLMFKNDKKKVNDFDSVYLEYDNEYGRLLKAKKDIKAGEIVFIEKPYVTVPTWSKHLVCCNHCLKMTWSNIPCDSCTWAVYCSEECKKIAWKEYHDIECTIIHQNENFGVRESNDGIRMFIMGIKEAGNLNLLKTMIEKGKYMGINTSIEEFVDLTFEKFYFSSNIIDRDLSVYYSDQVGSVRIASMAYGVLKNLIFLTRNSPAFVDPVTLKDFRDFNCFKRNDMAVFTCLHFMKVAEISSSYGHKISSLQILVPDGGIGSGVPRISSFTNHSCYQNVNHCFSDDRKLIVYACRPIKKNEQLFDCYTRVFFLLKKEDRIKFNGTFTCKCIACLENWPAVLDNAQFYDNDRLESTKNSKERAKILQANVEFGIATFKFTHRSPETLEPLLDKISRIMPETFKNFPQPSFVSCSMISYLVMTFNKLYEYNNIFDENMNIGPMHLTIKNVQE